MKEKDLKFDRKKHLLYSKAVKKVILSQLAKQYPPEAAAAYWEKIQTAYLNMLDLIPYLGGKKNGQAGSVYDCAALFAYYQTIPDKPGLEEFEKMNDDLFLPHMQKGSYLNLNKPILMKAADFIYKTLAKRSLRHREDWPGNYIMETQPVPDGTKYVFLRCPIAELAKKLGYTHLMPAMCNPDYALLHCLHGDLIRTSTCGFGNQCDFWVVGDQSPCLKDHPRKKSEDGYLYNE